MNISQEKQKIRREIFRRRKALSETERQAAGHMAATHLFASRLWEKAGVVFCYADYNGELPTGEIADQALKDGKLLALPKVLEPGKMEFYRIFDRGQDLEPGAFGIPEPKSTLPIVRPGDKTLFLIPGTAYDKAGNRMGYGGGFYDRYRAVHRPGVAVGTGYSFQVLEEIPTGPYDLPVEMLLTEKGLLGLPEK